MSLGDETARTREALKAGVAASVHDLIEQAQILTEETRKGNRRSLVLAWLAGVAVVVVVLIAVLVGINQFQVRHVVHQGQKSQIQLLDIARQNQANGDAVRDCTTPGGVCFERSQAQTGVAIMKLALAFCAGIHPHDPAGAQQCGVAALAALRGKP